MTGVDLRQANLTEAVLASADLSGDDLGEANLIGANLHDADLTDTNLAGVVVEAKDWFGLLKQRHFCPRDVERLERLWRTKAAGTLKNVSAGRLEPGLWFQLWPRGDQQECLP
jgi:hypothetical protein